MRLPFAFSFFFFCHKLIPLAGKNFVLAIQAFECSVEEFDFAGWFQSDFEQAIIVGTDDPGFVAGEFVFKETA